MNLHQPLSVLPGIGPKSAEKYKKLGIETVEDLLLYFPFRYEDFKSKNVLDLEDGEKAVVSGLVATPANVQYYSYKRNRLRFTISISCRRYLFHTVSYCISCINEFIDKLITLLSFIADNT